VVRLQDLFLSTPDLALTSSMARRRLRVDTITCDALLDMLVDATVLARTNKGAYVRYFPHAPREGTQPANRGTFSDSTRLYRSERVAITSNRERSSRDARRARGNRSIVRSAL
jgi:hypothetical protein